MPMAESTSTPVASPAHQVDSLRKSLKFSNFIFTLIRSYSELIGPHLALARAVVEQLDTFMKKTALAAIARLEKS